MEPKSEQKLKSDHEKQKTRSEKQKLGVLKEKNVDEKVNRIFYLT